MDSLTQIIAYEQGELDDFETVDLFQELVNTGLAWTLQGSYGRTAAAMLRSGAILPREEFMRQEKSPASFYPPSASN
jgi:hypothetical protein